MTDPTHIGILLDDERVAHESDLVRRIVGGLASRGNQVTLLLPETVDPEPFDTLGDTEPSPRLLAVPMRILPWQRHARLERLREAMDGDEPDALYAVGRGTWSLAGGLARLLDVPLAVDVWSSQLIRPASRDRIASMVGAFITPTAPIAASLRERTRHDIVSVVPVGVPVTDDPPRPDPNDPPTLAVVGSCADVPSYRALLSGIAAVARDQPGLQVFIELGGRSGHEIWRHAQRLDLLSNVTAIGDADHLRSLLTQCHAVVLPERFVEVRSLVLQAMSYARPVITAGSSFLLALRDDETALLVHEPQPDHWARGIRRLTTSDDDWIRLGDAARQFILDAHQPHHQLDALESTIRQMVSGGAMTFSPDPPPDAPQT